MSTLNDLETKAKSEEVTVAAWIKAHWLKISISHVLGWVGALVMKHIL